MTSHDNSEAAANDSIVLLHIFWDPFEPKLSQFFDCKVHGEDHVFLLLGFEAIHSANLMSGY